MARSKFDPWNSNYNTPKVKAGCLLLSEPLLLDDNFSRSVVLVTQHDPKGSFGLVLNKPVNSLVSSIIDGFEGVDMPLYLGGPVEQDTLHYIHTLGDSVRGSIPMGNGLYWGGGIDDLRRLAKLGKLNEESARFFIGYSGWGAKQLDRELVQKSWIVTSLSAHKILKTSSEKLWEQTVEELGGSFKLWLNFPVDPLLN